MNHLQRQVMKGLESIDRRKDGKHQYKTHEYAVILHQGQVGKMIADIMTRDPV